MNYQVQDNFQLIKFNRFNPLFLHVLDFNHNFLYVFPRSFGLYFSILSRFPMVSKVKSLFKCCSSGFFNLLTLGKSEQFKEYCNLIGQEHDQTHFKPLYQSGDFINVKNSNSYFGSSLKYVRSNRWNI